MPEIEGYKREYSLFQLLHKPKNIFSVMKLKVRPDSSNSLVYAREHFIRVVDAEKPKGRTLFLVNIPPYVSESNLQKVFSKFGKVEKIVFAEKAGRDEVWPTPDIFTLERSPFKYKVAFVVFSDSKSLQPALKLNSIDLFDESGNTLVKSGLDKYMEEFLSKFVPEGILQEKIDDFMRIYDLSEKQEREAGKTQEDDDGWVTVGSQGRNSGFQQTESVINKLETKIAKSKKDKELKNFYTFQIRENKMKKIVDLRNKFEEDKKKIEIMKQTRRFKPF